MRFKWSHGLGCRISSWMGCIVTSKFGRKVNLVIGFGFYKGIFLFCVVEMV